MCRSFLHQVVRWEHVRAAEACLSDRSLDHTSEMCLKCPAHPAWIHPTTAQTGTLRATTIFEGVSVSYCQTGGSEEILTAFKDNGMNNYLPTSSSANPRLLSQRQRLSIVSVFSQRLEEHMYHPATV